MQTRQMNGQNLLQALYTCVQRQMLKSSVTMTGQFREDNGPEFRMNFLYIQQNSLGRNTSFKIERPRLPIKPSQKSKIIQKIRHQANHLSSLSLINHTRVIEIKPNPNRFIYTFNRQRQNCSICYDSIKKRARVPRLACGHIFHSSCLKNWCATSRATCPICRQNIFP